MLQEGELIQRWVMNEANYKGEVQRLWISSQPLKPSKKVSKLKTFPTTIIYITAF
jgi:hypothetical protein